MIDVMLLLMIVWLVPIANSKTSLLSLIIGVAILLASRVPVVQRHFWAFAVTGILVVGVADSTFSLKGQVLQASGRDESFTGRTGIWETVLSEDFNPVVGTGYASFWLGDRLDRIWKKYPRTPLIQAHNGYIETYINLGVIGLLLLVCVLVTGLRRARGRLSAPLSAAEGFDTQVIATLGTPYCIAYLFYNWTEATFTAMNILFLIFIVLAFEYRHAPEARRVLVPVAPKANGQLGSQSLVPSQRVLEHRRKWGYR
jgi:O-antigen ligase